ncbi:MAG: hypothetical protein ACI4V3_05465 [Faecousia sp.]
MAIIFPEQLDDWIVDGARVIVTATAGGNSAQFTQECNENDEVVIDGLGDLFQDLSDGNPITCTLETQAYMDEDAETPEDPNVEEFTLIRSAVRIGETAANFNARAFLNMQQGTKDTYIGATERLSIYTDTKGFQNLTLKKTWADVETGETAETTETVKSLYVFQAGFCTWQFNVNDDGAPAENMQLVEIEASVGERVQRYEVRACRDAVPFSISYINNFGVKDTFHFFGGQTRTVQAERESALFSGGNAFTRTYSVTRTTETTARTGILREESLRAFEDLCCTKQAWNAEGNEIYIKDNELEYSDAYGSPQQGSITYGESNARAAFSKGKEADTFDWSFDGSFK